MSKWIINKNGNLIYKVRSIGNWDIGLINYNNVNNTRTYLMVRGKYYGETPIIYHDFKVGYTYPERIPNSVRKYIRENARKLKQLEDYWNLHKIR
jgi:hypothetical protein